MTLELAKLFLQLGVAGAALFLVYHLINKVFTYLGSRSSSDNKVDKLCDKIDKLVDIINKSSSKTNELVALNNQMQVILKNGLDVQFTAVCDIQSKVDKIDVRTKQCLDK
jgi:flavodoxin